MRNTLALALLAAACTVPSIAELEPKRCDGTHPCVDGYTCNVSGICEASSGGPCTGSETRMCGSSKGECRTGTQTCTGGMFGPCEGAVGPSEELCDGKNNDCDDETDEGVFDTNPCELTSGVCAGKHHACVAGHFETTCGAASYGSDWEAFESRCDGKDNDCDGDLDESGGACASVGVCVGASLTCAGVCMAAGFEATELSCDGKDNDCDGTADEGIDNGVSCGVSAGVCSGKNHACAGDGGFEPTCTAKSFGSTWEPTESRCDGLDNDCNGTTDRLVDGGALLAGGLCERQQGVCAGAVRACVDGGGENPCTLASYGSRYEPFELSCDTFDNDCDGRADRSRETGFATGSGTQSHASFVVGSAGIGLVYAVDNAGSKRVLYRFQPQVGAGIGPIDIGEPTASASTDPSIASLDSTSVIAVWLDAPGTRVVVARIAFATGAVMWRTPVSSGRNVFGSPSVGARLTIAMVGWIDAQTATLRGAVVDSSGNITTPATTLTTPTLSDGGFIEQVLSADVSDRPGSGFMVGWTAFQAGDSFFRIRPWNSGLTALGPVVENLYATEAARGARVSSDGTEVTAAWIGVGTTQNVHFLRADAGHVLVTSSANTVNDLDVSGKFVAWTDGQRLLGYQVGVSSSPADYSPDAGTAFSPNLTAVGANGVLLGYEIDKGQGLDIYAQSICLP